MRRPTDASGQGDTWPAGWYLLQRTVPPLDGRTALRGEDELPGDVRRAVRIDIASGPAAAAGGEDGVVILLTRATRALRLDDHTPFQLHPIPRTHALWRMLDGLRRRDGGRDWPRLAGVLLRAGLLVVAGRAPRAMDVLRAAYMGSAASSQPCRVRIGLVPLRAAWTPLDQLRLLTRDGDHCTWEAYGEDPKFRLERDGRPMPMPPGWYRFRARVSALQGRVIAPCLYADYGQATNQAELIALPPPGRDGRIDALVLLRHPTRGLRFDPTMRRARFAMSRMSLRSVDRVRALHDMLYVHGVEQSSAATSLRAFIGKWRALGLSPATDWLYRRYQAALVPANRNYRDWVRRYDTLSSAELRLLSADPANGASDGTPRFSILLPVYDTPEHWLRRCLDSVLAQTCRDWELCVVDDASPAPHVRRVLAEYQSRDRRIRVEYRQDNGHISAASNSALDMACGSFVCLLDHDDELRPHALHELALALDADPALVLLYSDEDKIDEAGERFEPYFKPDWNHDLLLGQNYVCHLMAIRTDAARACGGFRVGFEGSQDHDLVLRVARGLPPEAIHHVAKVLYHWRAIPGSTALHREAKDYAALAGARAVQEAVALQSPGARVEVMDHGHYRVHWPLPDPPPRVSLIVPTRDRPALLRTCVRSLVERTQYPDFELLLVDNGSVDPEALSELDALAADPRVRLLRHDAPFNYSRINNWAARQATGQVLALVNNDIEVIDPGWLEEMVAQALRPGVGAVGAMLLYPDGRIQHAGVVLGLGGIANHAYVGQPGDAPGHGGRARVVQSMSAVTAACMVVRRDAFQAVGGLDEDLAVAFNDIDFCLRLRQAGLRNLWTPFARLYHHESASRGADTSGEKRERFLREVALMEDRWGAMLERDPAYNPNFSLIAPGYELADPPRC